MIAAPTSSPPSVAVSDRSARVFGLSFNNHGLIHQLSDRTEALMASAKDTPLGNWTREAYVEPTVPAVEEVSSHIEEMERVHVR